MIEANIGYTPSQLIKLGKTRTFYEMNIRETQELAFNYAKENMGAIFTQIHGETNWSTGKYYSGFHLVNRTGRYLVLIPAKPIEINSNTTIVDRWDFRNLK